MSSRYRSIPRIAALVLVVGAFPGCAGWHAVKGPPAEYIAKEKPDVVRLTLADSTLVLSRPTVSGDAVMGKGKNGRSPRVVGVPQAEIRSMEIHTTRGSKGAKFAAVSVTVLFVSFAVLAAVAGGHVSVP